MLKRTCILISLLCSAILIQPVLAELPDGLITFSEDGGWCWFEDPRVIIHKGRLIIGTVASGYQDKNLEGDIRVVIYELSTGLSAEIEIHDRFELDDHNSPVFQVLPGGGVIALYSKHGREDCFYYRMAEDEDLTRWSPIQRFTVSEGSRVTYSNPHLLSSEEGRIYNFYRGFDNLYKPSFVFSDDAGRNWTAGGVFIDVPGQTRHRPYVKYVSNGKDEIHMIYTEGHPRDYDNSVYHVVYRGGNLYTSDGQAIAPLKQGLQKPSDGTLVFQGGPDNVAWTIDIELDSSGRPFCLFSVQIGSQSDPNGKLGMDHRYHVARWNGSKWTEAQLSYAGRRLYEGEDDYTGLAALIPGNPEHVYISTDSEPSTGEPLISSSDGKRHYEIYKGTLSRGGGWNWTPVTRNSTADNIRPIIPAPESGISALLWLHGEYRSYTDYSLKVVGLPLQFD